MKKRMVCVLLGIMCLAGCASAKKDAVEMNTGAIVIADEVADTVEATEDAETDSELAIEDEQVAMSGLIDFVYNDFLSEYENDLSRITIRSGDEVELIDRGDKLELKNAIVYRDYYLDAEVVENARVGDTIEIQKIPYRIDQIDVEEGYGYSVQLTPEVDNDWEKGIYAYEDIYEFSRSNDGKHYSVVFCSDDLISEQIYAGSVFFDKDAMINTYVGEDICDIAVKDYIEQTEYPYISSWSFILDKNGLISFVQNQIAG